MSIASAKNVAQNKNGKTNLPAYQGNVERVEQSGVDTNVLKKPLMHIPSDLSLNIDSMDIDDLEVLSNGKFGEVKKVLDRIVVGGIGKYHVTLIRPLAKIVADDLERLLAGDDDAQKN